MAQGNLSKYQSEFTFNFQFMKKVMKSFCISDRYIIYPEHFPVSTVGHSP
jgi:hypothetical protein